VQLQLPVCGAGLVRVEVSTTLSNLAVGSFDCNLTILGVSAMGIVIWTFSEQIKLKL
jgi:hypothetical protein